MMIKILRCTCANAWQDAKYGAGQRVMNNIPVAAGMTPKWRCTVCGAEQSAAKKG